MVYEECYATYMNVSVNKTSAQLPTFQRLQRYIYTYVIQLMLYTHFI